MARRRRTSQDPSAAFERDALRWLRAYPRRWRRTRQDEVLGLLADLAAPGARRLTAADRRGLLRGGMATRWRTHPPLLAWIAYRLFDRRIPRQHAAWAADDIDGLWFPVRSMLASLWWLPIMAVVGDWGWRQLWPLPVALLLAMLLWPHAGRERAMLKHVVRRAGDPWVAGGWLVHDVPRRAVTARSAAPWAVGLCTVVAVAGTAGSLLGPKAVHTRLYADGSGWENFVAPVGEYRVLPLWLLGAALLLGLLFAWLGAVRLRRVRGQRPPQPDRQLSVVSVRGRLVILTWGAVAVTVAVLETTGALVVGFGALAGAAALLVLPGALVALRVARTDDEEPQLAARDVRAVMTTGEPPRPDRPVEQPVPEIELVPARSLAGAESDRPTPAAG